MEDEKIIYHVNDKKFFGRAYYDSNQKNALPVVLVAHAFRGQDDFALEKAKHLAKMGYLAFAIDNYGEGQTVATNQEGSALMTPLFVDRNTLRARMVAAYEAIKQHPLADAKKIGAIGFCFGGLSAIELFRSGVDLKGVVCFHALLGNKEGENVAKTAPVTTKPKGSILILHGYKDPLVSQEDITQFQSELDSYAIDWQMNVYGQATHAFTNPEAKDPKSGLLYHAQTAARAWESMRNFFEEVFKR